MLICRHDLTVNSEEDCKKYHKGMGSGRLDLVIWPVLAVIAVVAFFFVAFVRGQSGM
ncbi:MAG TPA: hypothetical protein V6C81_12275 [Planktothrix sp.]|jgi:hypothetical protein